MSAEAWEQGIAQVVLDAGLKLEPRQLQKLSGYLTLLRTWNTTYNLTAVRDPAEMLSLHLADCCAVVAPLQRHLAQAVDTGSEGRAGRKLLDVGSGGGLPGVLLAILCPDLSVTCVDTVGKKAAFIRQVAAEQRLPNVRAEHARVQALTGRYDVIASRAFASLADFTAWTAHLLAPAGVWMAMKGQPPEAEIEALPAGVTVTAIEPLRVPGLDAERCLVWMGRHAA